jgi:hypothetical protein
MRFLLFIYIFLTRFDIFFLGKYLLSLDFALFSLITFLTSSVSWRHNILCGTSMILHKHQKTHFGIFASNMCIHIISSNRVSKLWLNDVFISPFAAFSKQHTTFAKLWLESRNIVLLVYIQIWNSSDEWWGNMQIIHTLIRDSSYFYQIY